MDDITFAVLGTGGIGRRALEVSQHKGALTPVAACDRHGVAFDFDGLDVDELLAATEGNIDNEVATDGGTGTAAAEGGVKQHGEDRGVGPKSGYEDNRGTVREDIAHLPEYDIETARNLSDEEIEAITDDHDGVIEFEDMEHADDVLLERAGVCDAADVTVGGVLDVRNDEKPTTTTVRVTGRTFDGQTATNTFPLGDETSMEANVDGPALGYLKAGVRRNRSGEYGVLGPADLLPGF